MGIHDRDYYRRSPPQAGAGSGRSGRGPRMWSITAWLILINVTVFLVDLFLPPTWVYMETVFRDPTLAAQLDPEALVYGPQQEWTVDTQTAVLRKPVHLQTPDGTVVADNYFRPMRRLAAYLHFSTQKGFLTTRVPAEGLVGFEFWRLIGFQFLHADGMHLLFNMLGLYFFGGIVEAFLGRKRYLAFYLLCGIFGALLYLVLNLASVVVEMVGGGPITVPGLLFNDVWVPLIGASAGVYGVLMAGAYLAPNATVLFYFFIPVRLRTFAYLLVGVAFVTVLVGGTNAGGEAGHLGGALAGFYFIRRPNHLHGFFDFLGRLDPTSHHYRKGTGGRRTLPSSRAPRRPKEIDRILDKIHDRGIQSLTEQEKRILAEESEN